MRIIRASEFTPAAAWESDHIATIEGATVKLHWTDQPYHWHVNTGDEVFTVLDGSVDMHVRIDGEEAVHRLEVGDIFYAEQGAEHVAHPNGPCRVLVVEKQGSE